MRQTFFFLKFRFKDVQSKHLNNQLEFFCFKSSIRKLSFLCKIYSTQKVRKTLDLKCQNFCVNAWPEIQVLTQPYFESIYYLVGSTVSVNRGKVLLLSSFEAISCNLLKGMTLSHTQTPSIKVLLVLIFLLVWAVWSSWIYCIFYTLRF